ncbi:hypothetical protein [Dyadobacter bucti]|uniref:hypothetical protein n=1 Tax=Dyadobacter bucti TaxID=2572203 RepID=UPI003F7035F0
MSQTPVLSIVIGLVFIYLLYSLLASILQEMLANRLAFRSKILEKAIIRMLEDGKSTSNFGYLDRILGIFRLLGKPNLLISRHVAAWFYVHPLIKYLGEDNFYSKPAYLSSKNFSKVMIDLLSGFDNPENITQAIHDSILAGTIHNLPVNLNTDTKNPAVTAVRANIYNAAQVPSEEFVTIVPQSTTAVNKDTILFLQSIWRESNGDIDKFKAHLELWFDDTMERTSGWYKRYNQYFLFIIGLILAIGFNVDTISIVKKLGSNPTQAERLVQMAEVFSDTRKEMAQNSIAGKAVNPKDLDALEAREKELLQRADSLLSKDINEVNRLMGLGWQAKEGKHLDYNKTGFLCLKCNDQDASSLIGWLMTALAISLGAPFWFDLLNKFMKLRSTGNRINSQGRDRTEPSATPANAPVSVNINTQPTEEALG